MTPILRMVFVCTFVVCASGVNPGGVEKRPAFDHGIPTNPEPTPPKDREDGHSSDISDDPNDTSDDPEISHELEAKFFQHVHKNIKEIMAGEALPQEFSELKVFSEFQEGFSEENRAALREALAPASEKSWRMFWDHHPTETLLEDEERGSDQLLARGEQTPKIPNARGEQTPQPSRIQPHHQLRRGAGVHAGEQVFKEARAQVENPAIRSVRWPKSSRGKYKIKVELDVDGRQHTDAQRLTFMHMFKFIKGLSTIERKARNIEFVYVDGQNLGSRIIMINTGSARSGSDIGYKGAGRPTKIRLGMNNAHYGSSSTIIHELLHALGFGHTNQRNNWRQCRQGPGGGYNNDREPNNCKPWNEKYPSYHPQDHGKYDYASIMHYPNSNSGRMCARIRPKPLSRLFTLEQRKQLCGNPAMLGKGNVLSRRDIDALNLFYS